MKHRARSTESRSNGADGDRELSSNRRVVEAVHPSLLENRAVRAGKPAERSAYSGAFLATFAEEGRVGSVDRASAGCRARFVLFAAQHGAADLEASVDDGAGDPAARLLGGVLEKPEVAQRFVDGVAGEIVAPRDPSSGGDPALDLPLDLHGPELRAPELRAPDAAAPDLAIENGIARGDRVSEEFRSCDQGVSLASYPAVVDLQAIGARQVILGRLRRQNTPGENLLSIVSLR